MLELAPSVVAAADPEVDVATLDSAAVVAAADEMNVAVLLAFSQGATTH
jgi:hypothetical protein